DLVGVELADVTADPKVLEGRDLHQLVLRVVVVTPDGRPLDHDPGGARAEDHLGFFHSVLIRNISDLVLGEAEDQELVLRQLHLQVALGFIVLGLDQVFARYGVGLGQRGLVIEHFLVAVMLADGRLVVVLGYGKVSAEQIQQRGSRLDHGAEVHQHVVDPAVELGSHDRQLGGVVVGSAVEPQQRGECLLLDGDRPNADPLELIRGETDQVIPWSPVGQLRYPSLAGPVLIGMGAAGELPPDVLDAAPGAMIHRQPGADASDHRKEEGEFPAYLHRADPPKPPRTTIQTVSCEECSVHTWNWAEPLPPPGNSACSGRCSWSPPRRHQPLSLPIRMEPGRNCRESASCTWSGTVYKSSHQPPRCREAS